MAKTKRKPKPVPDGYHTVTPYLIVNDASGAIAFYEEAFGAEEQFRMSHPDGKVGHAEIRIGDSTIMLADEVPSMGFRGPESIGDTPVSILLYVEDVDARFARALSAGAEERRPLQDQFYGDRSGTLQDPFGHVWTLATRVEDVNPAEIQARFQSMMKQGV